jgi:hypothetical protein
MDSHAVIAGGSILSCLTNGRISEASRKISDLDIYVCARDAKTLLEGLCLNGWRVNDAAHIAPPYDQSFFRKNHILMRQRLHNAFKPYSANGETIVEQVLPFIDIIVIDDGYTIQQVVSNFDLTFCQVWYDGIAVHATHMQDIRSKKGSLQPEYHTAYLAGNSFIQKRMDKYRKRGFTIAVPEGVAPVVFTRKQVTSELDWLIYKVLQFIIKCSPLDRIRLTQTLRHIPKTIQELKELYQTIFERRVLVREFELFMAFSFQSFYSNPDHAFMPLYNAMIERFISPEILAVSKVIARPIEYRVKGRLPPFTVKTPPPLFNPSEFRQNNALLPNDVTRYGLIGRYPCLVGVALIAQRTDPVIFIDDLVSALVYQDSVGFEAVGVGQASFFRLRRAPEPEVAEQKAQEGRRNMSIKSKKTKTQRKKTKTQRKKTKTQRKKTKTQNRTIRH